MSQSEDTEHVANWDSADESDHLPSQPGSTISERVNTVLYVWDSQISDEGISADADSIMDVES